MKSTIPMVALALLVTVACSDDDLANLLVTSQHDGKPVGQSMVYLTEGHDIDPELGLKYFSFSQRSDGTGEAYFRGIASGEYTVYVYGFYNNQRVEGWQEVIVSSEKRNKTTKIIVELDHD